MSSALMSGFPSAQADLVTLANWRTAPYSKWAFQHVREIVPSADIPNAPGDVWELVSEPKNLSSIRFDHGGKQYGIDKFLDETDTDGLVILHRGNVILEHYENGMTSNTPHILMSVSKSITAIVAGILIEQGKLDPEQAVVSIIPELKDSVYSDATVRHVLDMRVGLDFAEDYLATSGPIVEYRKSANWNPLGGTLLWKPMGAQSSAYITVDRLGAPRCAGGICTTTMDLARVGQLIVQDGRRNDTPIVPAGWIEDMLGGGDPRAWAAGDLISYFGDRTMHYRNQWYVVRDSGIALGLGVYGQNVFVDKAKEIVVAKVSSQAAPLDKDLIDLTITFVGAMSDHLD